MAEKAISVVDREKKDGETSSPLEQSPFELLVDRIENLDLALISEHSEKHVDGDLLGLVGEGIDVGSVKIKSRELGEISFESRAKRREKRTFQHSCSHRSATRRESSFPIE